MTINQILEAAELAANPPGIVDVDPVVVLHEFRFDTEKEYQLEAETYFRWLNGIGRDDRGSPDEVAE